MCFPRAISSGKGAEVTGRLTAVLTASLQVCDAGSPRSPSRRGGVHSSWELCWATDLDALQQDSIFLSLRMARISADIWGFSVLCRNYF